MEAIFYYTPKPNLNSSECALDHGQSVHVWYEAALHNSLQNGTTESSSAGSDGIQIGEKQKAATAAWLLGEEMASGIPWGPGKRLVSW